LNDLERESEFLTINFYLSNGETLPIATTRPELLPACVAVFVHPSDKRFLHLAGKSATVPLFGQTVPILTDPAAEPEKGTGAVMCCTFGDVTDVAWWNIHNLQLVELITQDGTLSQIAGEFTGLTIAKAKKEIVEALEAGGNVICFTPTIHSIRVHERCDTPAEYIITPQWFIRMLDQKESLLKAGEKVAWHPSHMKTRYIAWVENLKWDWCISRQRHFGVQFPLWYCNNCKEIILANESDLPVDPFRDSPPLNRCPNCGSQEFIPEKDVFDTWMTSSMTPQICGGWREDPERYKLVFPFSLRPQAHEIIRTWAFYTIYKSKNHFDQVPWKHTAISGWGVAAEGMGKISKSRGGGPMPPLKMIDLYSADAVRYWSASTGLGKDSIISEEKVQTGARLVTKIWNVARFAERFLSDYTPPGFPPQLSPGDQWILSRLQRLIERSTQLFENYDYATVKSEVETFFWTEFADNYIEMCKQRLYEQHGPGFDGAQYALYSTLLTLLKLLAPILPFITEEIYQNIFIRVVDNRSIHSTAWPVQDVNLINDHAEQIGKTLLEVATFVRRYKSERNLPLGTKLTVLRLTTDKDYLAESLHLASADLISITRAERLEILCESGLDIPAQTSVGTISIQIEP
jgi:valyl-tRNA synthetase